MKRILMIHTRELCYFSGGFFLDRMEEALEKQGVEITRVDIGEAEDNLDCLENYMGRHYDGVVDINSKLPYFLLPEEVSDREDDRTKVRYFLDEIHAPFYNYILDHPLYHHPGLVFPLKNYHCLGIDYVHCDYMKQWYPHIQSVDYLPVAGTKAIIEKPMEERKISVLFTGTYEDEEKQLLMLKEMEALPQLQQLSYPERMNYLYPKDKYLRNRQRRTILEGLAKRGVPLTVMGEGWEQTRLPLYENVNILPGQPIARSIERIGEARVLLDINPLFPKGMHDRVTTALANHTVCISNMSEETDIQLAHGENIFYYQDQEIDMIMETLEALGLASENEQANTSLLSEVAVRGHERYLQEYSWERHAEKFLDILAKNES